MIRKISIQDVTPRRNESTSSEPSRRERDYLIERLTRKHTTAPAVSSSTNRTKNRRAKNSRSGKKWFWFLSPLVVILFLFIVLQFMVSATVTVKPKQSTVQVDTKLTASIDATTSPNTLMYQIITLNATDDETVLATGAVTTKSQKASGQIIIFNNFSNAPQTLIKDTRFETPDGLIYRLQSAVKVPGFTTSGGKTVAGSITVAVIADQIGSKYNIDMVDFTIPGFKTDANRYAKIFARSKTTMTGGTDGNSFGITNAVRQSAQANIEARLRESLLRQVKTEKTADSIIFDTANKISFQRLADTAGVDTGHAVVHERGTISAVVFDKKVLGKLLLSDAIAAVGNNAEIHGLENLHFIAAVSSTSPIWQAKPFVFTLTGQVDLTGVVDTAKLMQDILGLPRSSFTKILSNYPTIDTASLKVKPFWRSTIPADASKIKIEVVK